MTRLPSLVAFTSVCALTAGLLLPGLAVGRPALAAPDGLAEGPGAEARAGADGAAPSEGSAPGADARAADPRAASAAPGALADPVEFPADARFELDDDAYRGGSLELRGGAESDAGDHVYRIGPDSPPEIPPGESFAAGPESFTVGIDRAGGAPGRTQPHSFTVTAISGGDLTIAETTDDPGRPPAEPYASGPAELVEISGEKPAGPWAFDVDHEMTTTWTVTPDPALGSEAPDDGRGDEGDDEGGDGSDDGTGDDGPDEGADDGSDEGPTEGTNPENDGANPPGEAYPEDGEPTAEDAAPLAASPQVVCIALESRGTSEGGSGLTADDPARTVLTLVFDDTAEVEPCSPRPADWGDAADGGERTGPEDATAPAPHAAATYPGSIPVLPTHVRVPARGDGGGGDDGDRFYRHDGDGLDLTDHTLVGYDRGTGLPEGRWARIRFEMRSAPDGATATYRNSSGIPADTGGWFHSLKYNEREFSVGAPAHTYHRPLPTRDSFASWSFTEPGTYCIAVGIHATDDPAGLGEPARVEPAVVRFDVGPGTDDSVDCTEEPPGDIEIPPPGDDGPGGGSEDDRRGMEPPENGVNGKRPGMPAPGGSGHEPGRGDAERGASARPTPSPTPSRPATRVQQAPPLIRHCPAEVGGAVQVHDGRVDLTAVLDDGALSGGFADLRGAEPRAIGPGLDVVVPATATRRITPDAGALGAATDSVWATDVGRTGVPQLGWDFSGIDAAEAGEVTLAVERVEGPGGFAILDTSSGDLLADSSTPLTVPAGESGTGAFAFERPGDYTVTLSATTTAAEGSGLEPVSYKINFAVGDENTAVAESPLLRALVSGCGGMNVGTDLMDWTDPGPDQQAAPDPGESQSSGVLGDQWWIVASVTMGLAGLLGLAVLVVLMRESRR